MIRRMTGLAALGLALSAAPALAADPATLSCVEEGLDQATIDQLGADFDRNVRQDGPQTYSPDVIARVKEVADACAARHGWSEGAAVDAMLYTVARLGIPVVRRVAVERDVDPDAIEALYTALPVETRRQMIGPETLGLLAGQAHDRGLSTTEDQGSIAGGLFAILSILESNRYDFALR